MQSRERTQEAPLVATAQPRSGRTSGTSDRSPSLVVLSLVVAASVAAALSLAIRDQDRSFDRAREEFTAEQVALAESAATHLGTELSAVRHDALLAAEEVAQGVRLSPAIAQSYLDLRVRSASDPPLRSVPASDALVLSVPVTDGRIVDVAISLGRMMRGMSVLHRPREHRLLLHPPDASGFVASDGRWLQAPAVERAFAEGRVSTMLTREQAGRLGLEERDAEAGLARVDAGPLGQWQLAILASQARLRDREAHAQLRLLLGQLFTIGALLLLGSVALRAERRKQDALQLLADAELQRERESRLDRESRAAAMITFAGGMAHEISSPLIVIAGRAEQLFSGGSQDPRAERAVQVIRKEVEFIRQVTRGFLELARGDAPPMAPVSPDGVVKRAVSLCEHRFASAGVRLESAVPADLPSVRGDARLLAQALVNLLLNACDACSAGCVVRVEGRVVDGHVRFTVTDDGAGISPSDAARAVEPFFTTKRHGTGLGLAITNEIMKVHRGDLALSPREDGDGTVATISVPVAADDVDAIA